MTTAMPGLQRSDRRRRVRAQPRSATRDPADERRILRDADERALPI
jgi:hypothetical protein